MAEQKRQECPLGSICTEDWKDFALGNKGEMLDSDCPTRQALETGKLTEETAQFIKTKIYERTIYAPNAPKSFLAAL